MPILLAMRHYARAVAFAQQRDQRGFDAEIAAMSALASSDALAPMIAQGVPAPDLIALAIAVARGRLATAQHRYAQAADHYRAAIALERRIPYQEPAYWYYPVHQSLGAALFLASRPDEAAAAFRQALIQAPNNGWALYDLARAEAAQGHKAEAAAARNAFDRAWSGNPDWLRIDRL